MDIEKISINGKIYPTSSATVKATDHGLMYGVNAFESLRVHEGKAFLLEKHFDRLNKSLSGLGINWDDNRPKYYSWIADICDDLPKDKDAFVRFVVLAGSKVFWVAEEEYDKPTVIIYRGNIPPFLPTAKKAVIVKSVNRNKPEYFAKTGFRIKTMDYVSARVAKLEVKKSGKNLDGIMLTSEGFVAEGLTSNIFWFKEGKLYTPPLSTGILAGTMRSYIMENNHVEEVLAPAEELESAEEIIFTSGSSYLNPLSEINGHKKLGTEGPVFKSLYSQLQKDIEESSRSFL